MTNQEKFLALGSFPKTKRKDFDIEVVSIEPLSSEHISVFVRVWDDKGQVGFGPDGTVDIEKIKIHNPYILVPDGTKYEITNDVGKKIAYDNLKEDVKEALLQMLENTIIVKKEKFDDTKIVVGKVGKTTSTYYPAAGATSPVDGQIQYDWDNASSWATIRAASSATGPNVTSPGVTVRSYYLGGTGYNLMRGFFLFDTSDIGTDEITSATFSAYCSATDSAGDSGGNFALVRTNPAATNTLANGDFDAAGKSRTQLNSCPEGSNSRVAITTATGAYWNWSMNSTGIGWISKTATPTKLGLNEGSCDMDAATPTGGNQADFTSADAGSNKPKLVVEHAPASSNSNFLLFMGNPQPQI